MKANSLCLSLLAGLFLIISSPFLSAKDKGGSASGMKGNLVLSPEIQVTQSDSGQSKESASGPSAEKKNWDEQKEKIAQKIAEYQYANAISLLTDFYNSIENEMLKQEVGYYIEDLKGEMALFSYMVKELVGKEGRKKVVIHGLNIWVTKADETGFEGYFADESRAVYARQWKDLDPKTVYGLFPKELSKLNYFYLALFCYNHKLPREGDRILIDCFRRYPDIQERISRFIARYRNVPMPPGGFNEYEGQIVTAEEKSYLEKDYVKHEGKWVPYEEMMVSKGLVMFQGKWVTREQ
ncbi:MAG: hypothetical protein QME51_07770, partial [Planctomycetota bacterium]|nr:hypothetical protein [Planctomycetota bacterium]